MTTKLACLILRFLKWDIKDTLIIQGVVWDVSLLDEYVADNNGEYTVTLKYKLTKKDK